MARKPKDFASLKLVLPQTLCTFVAERAETSYGSPSAYECELIREDRRRLAHTAVNVKLLEGLASGDPIDVTPEFWKALRKRIANHRRRAGRA